MSEVVLKVSNVGKKFSRTLKSSALNGLKDVVKDLVGAKASRNYLRNGEFWALNGVSFELRRGESLGIVGSNGSGKSTLLRIISGIYPPDIGRVEVHGRIGALIALGAGFNPHMSGRENIFLNGSLLGMKRQEINAKLGEIIDFAEIGEFIDAPVSTYSSGMTVRLGFSIAAHAHPDILIVDEIMAVGDLAFALKCHRKMADFRRAGGTTLLVSHNNQLIRNICSRAIWLQHGICKQAGNADEVCAAYEADLLASTAVDSQSAQKLSFDKDVDLTDLRLNGYAEVDWPTFDSNNSLQLSLAIKARRAIRSPKISFAIENVEGVLAHCSFSFEDGKPLPDLSIGTFPISILLERLRLKTGAYYLTLTLAEEEVSNVIAWHQRAYSFKVYGGKANQGLIDLQPTWHFSQ